MQKTIEKLAAASGQRVAADPATSSPPSADKDMDKDKDGDKETKELHDLRDQIKQLETQCPTARRYRVKQVVMLWMLFGAALAKQGRSWQSGSHSSRDTL
eukprot:9165952-Pyramimonas_sp.AAC.1